MDILDLMREQDGDLLAHCIDSFENGDFEMAEQQWTLQDVEESIQTRIDYLSKTDLGDVPYREYTDCYMALAQIKQAQALERIVSLLEGFKASGFPVENVS